MRNKILMTAAGLLIVAGLVGVYIVNKNNNPMPSATSQTTATQPAKATPSQIATSGQTTKQVVANSAPTLEPTGSFVSNHKTSLASSSVNNAEQSVCTTSPGANCEISFSNGSITKQLQAMTADNTGSVYWSWKPQELGLSVGSWKITATANLNGNIKTATDSTLLEVTQ